MGRDTSTWGKQPWEVRLAVTITSYQGIIRDVELELKDSQYEDIVSNVAQASSNTACEQDEGQERESTSKTMLDVETDVFKKANDSANRALEEFKCDIVEEETEVVHSDRRSRQSAEIRRACDPTVVNPCDRFAYPLRCERRVLRPIERYETHASYVEVTKWPTSEAMMLEQ